MPFLIRSPCASARNNWGDWTPTFAVKEKSWKVTFPSPPPPPSLTLPLLEAPQLKLSSSISPLCLWSLLSPSMPSSFRNMSTAIALSLDQGKSKSGAAVATKLKMILPGHIGASGSQVASGTANNGESAFAFTACTGRARADNGAAGKDKSVQFQASRLVRCDFPVWVEPVIGGEKLADLCPCLSRRFVNDLAADQHANSGRRQLTALEVLRADAPLTAVNHQRRVFRRTLSTCRCQPGRGSDQGKPSFEGIPSIRGHRLTSRIKQS